MSPLRNAVLIFIIVCLCGCASLVKTSPTYHANIKHFKTIAVMPPDIEVYKLTAGGVRELMDEWSQVSQKYFQEGLQKHLASRFGVEIKFIKKDWLEENYPKIWRTNKALYYAVSNSALLHAYPGDSTFPAKAKKFDYTFGPEIQPLSQAVGADAILFIYGIDHEATAGWVLMSVLEQALLGVYTIVPSAMTLALVNGQTGDVEWYKISPPMVEYSFKSQKHMETLAEWMTRDFIMEK